MFFVCVEIIFGGYVESAVDCTWHKKTGSISESCFKPVTQKLCIGTY